MIRDIIKYGDPALETPAKHVHTFSDNLNLLIEDMFATMYASGGVGLAAPQIGIKKRIAVIDISFGKNEADKLVLINPEVTASEGKIEVDEGCLSLLGFRAKIKRSKTVTFKAQDKSGNPYEMKAEGYLAQAVQHEVEHLNGVLYINHCTPLKRDLIRRKIRKLQKQDLW